MLPAPTFCCARVLLLRSPRRQCAITWVRGAELLEVFICPHTHDDTGKDAGVLL